MAENITTDAFRPAAKTWAGLLLQPPSPLSSWPTPAVMAASASTLVAAWVAVCSLLRFRFEKRMRKKFNYPDRASMARMSNDDAQQILQYIMQWEFPFTYKLALQFAVFKVCSPVSLRLGGCLVSRQKLKPSDVRHPHHLKAHRGHDGLY